MPTLGCRQATGADVRSSRCLNNKRTTCDLSLDSVRRRTYPFRCKLFMTRIISSLLSLAEQPGSYSATPCRMTFDTADETPEESTAPRISKAEHGPRFRRDRERTVSNAVLARLHASETRLAQAAPSCPLKPRAREEVSPRSG